MKMCEIYVGIEKELHEIETALEGTEHLIDEYLAKASDAEAEMKKWQAKAEQVEAENKQKIINAAALKESLAALQKGDFAPSEEEIKAEEKERKQKETLATAKEYKPAKSWSRRKGEIGQFKPNGEIMNSWTSQRSAAYSLNWSQTGVGKFMKLDHATQIRRKGWYLEYMGK